MSNPLLKVIKEDGFLDAGHVIEEAQKAYPSGVILQSAGGWDRICFCGRVLYWEDLGGSYRAVCSCGRVHWEPKR